MEKLVKELIIELTKDIVEKDNSIEQWKEMYSDLFKKHNELLGKLKDRGIDIDL